MPRKAWCSARSADSQGQPDQGSLRSPPDRIGEEAPAQHRPGPLAAARWRPSVRRERVDPFPLLRLLHAMSEIVDLTTRRARSIAQAFMETYQRQRTAMRIAGVCSAELTTTDRGETVVADVAACMTVASVMSPVGLTTAVLRRMQGCDEKAFGVIASAVEVYFASEALQRDLGRAAAEPFRRLRDAMPGSA